MIQSLILPGDGGFWNSSLWRGKRRPVLNWLQAQARAEQANAVLKMTFKAYNTSASGQTPKA